MFLSALFNDDPIEMFIIS